MKSKKKMLLALGAMSAAAIGAGATSTFAWFSATQTVNLATTSNETLSVTQQGLDTVNLNVEFTYSSDDDVELTNSSGETYYVNADGATIKKTGNKAVGSFKVLTAAWVEDAAYTAAVADGTLAALAGKTYLVTLAGSTNVVLLANSTHSHTAATLKFEIKVASSSPYAISINSTTTNYVGMTYDGGAVGHFAVKATDTTTGASEKSAEAAHTTDIISVSSIA